MAVLLEGRCSTSSRSYQTLALKRAAALKPTPLHGERAAAAPAVSERLRHVCFCGLQWRAIGQLCDIAFGTLYTLFARWTRLGLWRRLLNRLILAWRHACSDKPIPSTGGHGGTFIPQGIRWVVERSLGWVSRYRRLNTIFERTEAHLVAFVEIAFISILSRRLVRLATPEISA